VLRALAVAGALAVVFGLAGCSLVGSSPKPAATSTAPSALASLVPTYPAKLTTATAKSGSVAAADAIQALIATSEIVHVDDQSTGFDTIDQGVAMEKLLVEAGWIERAENTSTSAYSVQLTTYTSAGVAALLIQADATPGAPPVILIELESPDLPKK